MPIEEELTLMRIFVGESDRWQHRPLYQAIVELLCAEGLAGATVLKGSMGFGARSELHSDRYLRLSSDLPVVIEAIDRPAQVEAVLPKLEQLCGGGLLTLENVRAFRFAAREESA
ncbi:MAG: DUF190 domain-containing protein [Desulfuromonadales bacterium]|nr:DUF190 domain-containing protein [Desulfuromonadales bacterium]